MKAFILSAGMGKRLLPYTLKTAKPCMPFLNIPLVAFNLQHLLNIGIKEFIFNTHHLHKETQKIITTLLKKKNVTLHFNHEKKLLSSAGGLKNISSHLRGEENFLMINADSLCLGNSNFLTDSIKLHKQNNALATLLCCPSPKESFKSIEVNQYNQITNIGPISKNNLHYMGYMVISSKIFSLIKKENAHIFTDVLLPYIQNIGLSKNTLSMVFATHTSSWKFFEVGNITDFNIAEKKCQDILSDKKDSALKNFLKQVNSSFTLN